ncbi:serine/threonine-protein kinase pim-2-like [Hemibagrus wyckioides]|nr:serine/threonine-protein kinase pim-2-like [Hemibagrus wyckioides]
MTKDPHDIFIAIPGETLKLPLEVALMKMVSKPPSCENMVELLEWFETSDIYILVLERPVPCMDLYRFCKLNNRRLSESVAREVMRQVVQAAHHCCLRGVLHRDIKPNNILINPDTLLVKLIDFGCGDLLIYEPYREYAGTDGYYPPEWVLQREYFGVPATVWSLGIVLYELVHGELPFMSDEELTDGRLCFHSGVSEECCDLIRLCLEQDPSSRPGFSEIQAHKWFKKESQDSVQGPANTPPSCSCDGETDVCCWCLWHHLRWTDIKGSRFYRILTSDVTTFLNATRTVVQLRLQRAESGMNRGVSLFTSLTILKNN